MTARPHTLNRNVATNSLEDVATRSKAELATLHLARHLAINRASVPSVEALVAIIASTGRSLRHCLQGQAEAITPATQLASLVLGIGGPLLPCRGVGCSSLCECVCTRQCPSTQRQAKARRGLYPILARMVPLRSLKLP